MFGISDPLRPELLNRRRLLQVGAFGTVGLSLPQLLQAETAGGGRSEMSCIMIFANGGPSQLDTFDPKPDAPAEIRGEFESIATTVPGVRVCEHLPKMAALAKEFALVRSVSHDIGAHMPAAYLALTGHRPNKLDHPVPATPADVPSVGSLIAKLRPAKAELPSYVVQPQLAYDAGYVQPGQHAGMLGDRYSPLVVDADPNIPDFRVKGLTLNGDLNPQRLAERLRLVSQIESRVDGLGRAIEARGLNEFHQQAHRLLSSSASKQAFDLKLEADDLRERYGRNRYGQSYLLARRLIESGVRMVMVNDILGHQNDRWDNHGGTFKPMRTALPETDAALSSLLIDLRERGLLDTTLVVWMGEMGRGPKAPHGDHWPQCYTVLMAGGGIQGGQVYGASDKHAAYPRDGACTPGDIIATIYHALGVPASTTVNDHKGRPIYVYNGEPIRTLFT